MQPAIGERKTGRRGRRPLRGARPETWRDKCGRGVPIGGVQTRDAGAGGVFRRAMIDRCGPSGRRIQNYVGCKALPCTAREKKVFARDAGAAAGIGVQAIRCGTFLHRSYNWTKGKSKNRRFLAAFFSIFLSLLKEIWPPEAYMQDAGATRNRRTENGPSGTPAPTEDQPRVRRYSRVRRYGPSGTPAPTRDRRECAGIRGCADAGRRGRRPLRRDIDESASVFEGAPMRAAEDAGPYGVRGLRHGEISVGGVCPLGAFKRGTQERQRG